MIRIANKRKKDFSRNAKRTKYTYTKMNKAPVKSTFKKPPFYRSMVGFPPKMTYKLKYNEAIQLTPSTTALTNYQFRANSLYDPDYTSTGHQPLYFDQIINIYDHYVVIGSKIKVTCNRNTSSANAARVCIYLNDDVSIGPSSLVTASEQSTGKVTSVGVVDTVPLYLSLGFSSKKIFGPNPLANANLKGSATTNPSEEAIFTILCQSTAASGSAIVEMFVEIEYTAIFFELKDMNTS